MTIKEKIKLIADYKGITGEKFCKKIGISSSNLYGKNAKSELGVDKIIKILLFYPEISADWLLLESGEMVRSENEKVTDKLREEKEVNVDVKMFLQIIENQNKTIELLAKANESLSQTIKILNEKFEKECNRHNVNHKLQ